MRKESKQKPGPLHVGLEIEQLLALDDGGRREYLSALLLEDFSPEWLAFVEHYRESLQRLEVTVSQKVIAIPVAALLAGVDRTLLDKVEKWVKMALGLESGAASLTIAPTGKPLRLSPVAHWDRGILQRHLEWYVAGEEELAAAALDEEMMLGPADVLEGMALGPTGDRASYFVTRLAGGEAAVTVTLVAESARQLPHAAPAGELYARSASFRLARTWAQRYSRAWYVLSARYGLLRPDKVVAPYHLASGYPSQRERREWTEKVVRQFVEAEPIRNRVVLLVGAHYREYLEPALAWAGYGVDGLHPLKLGWLMLGQFCGDGSTVVQSLITSDYLQV